MKILFPKRKTFQKWLLTFDVDKPIGPQLQEKGITNTGLYGSYFKMKGKNVAVRSDGYAYRLPKDAGIVPDQYTYNVKRRARKWMKELSDCIVVNDDGGLNQTPTQIYKILSDIEQPSGWA